MIGKEITKNFLEEVKQAITLNVYYNTDLINSKNTTELYGDYTRKNKNFEKIIKNMYGDILTQDRKTYYETQEYEALESWYKIFLSFYYILVVILLLSLIFLHNEFKTSQKIGIILLLVIYPFVINYIFTFVLGILNKIKNIIVPQSFSYNSSYFFIFYFLFFIF